MHSINLGRKNLGVIPTESHTFEWRIMKEEILSSLQEIETTEIAIVFMLAKAEALHGAFHRRTAIM